MSRDPARQERIAEELLDLAGDLFERLEKEIENPTGRVLGSKAREIHRELVRYRDDMIGLQEDPKKSG